MPTIYADQYRGIATGADNAQVPAGYIGTVKVAIGASTARSTTDFDNNCEILVLTCDADCQYELGDDTVEATAASRLLVSGVPFGISSDNFKRIAVIEKQ